MSNKHFLRLLKRGRGPERACAEAVAWVGKRTLVEAWRDCNRYDWMLWLCYRMRGKRGWPTTLEIEQAVAQMTHERANSTKAIAAVGEAYAAWYKATMVNTKAGAGAKELATWQKVTAAWQKNLADLIRPMLKVPGITTSWDDWNDYQQARLDDELVGDGGI